MQASLASRFRPCPASRGLLPAEEVAGTFTLAADLHALVILTWRPDGSGLAVRTLDRSEALACLPLIRKDLRAFDFDRRGRGAAVREVLAYSRLFDGVTVVEVSGRVDVPALLPIVDDLARATR